MVDSNICPFYVSACCSVGVCLCVRRWHGSCQPNAAKFNYRVDSETDSCSVMSRLHRSTGCQPWTSAWRPWTIE